MYETAKSKISFFFLFKVIYFNWRLITLQYCIGFAIHQLLIGLKTLSPLFKMQVSLRKESFGHLTTFRKQIYVSCTENRNGRPIGRRWETGNEKVPSGESIGPKNAGYKD